MRYTVFVDDNFHYMDESLMYKLGVIQTWNDAVKAAKAIVDEFLIENKSKTKSSEELFMAYCQYGEDPYIDIKDAYKKFSARKYAEDMSKELFKECI
jgi:hypothetical protein